MENNELLKEAIQACKPLPKYFLCGKSCLGAAILLDRWVSFFKMIF